MRIRQTIKRAAAIGTGVLMLGATILGASAANVSDYPSAFLTAGKVNAKIVVGEKADAIDVVGAIDIAADLQAAAVSKEAVTTTGTGVSVTNGKTKEVAILGNVGTEFTTLTKSDIPTLLDGKISWNDKDVNVEEKILLDGVTVSNSAIDTDFGSKVYLTTGATEAIQYRYILEDDDLNISDVTEDEPLRLDFLGKAVEIQDVGADEMTVSVASEYYMSVGDSVTVDGKKVTLKNVGSNDNVVVDVDGVIKTVGATSEKVNGIRIEVSSAFYVDDVTQRSATLKIGDKITDTVSDGDSMELFGEPSTESDAEWVWHIDADATTDVTTMTIGAYFNQRYDTDTEPVKAMGEKYNLPNNYASVYMASATAEADVDIDFEFEDGVSIDLLETGLDYDDSLGEDLNSLKLTATKDVFTLDVNGENETAEVVYLLDTNSTSPIRVAYEDNDGNVRLASAAALETFWVIYEDTWMSMSYQNSSTEANLTIAGELATAATTINLVADITAKNFGATEADYEAGYDVVFTGITVDKDEDYLTTWGNIIYGVEDLFDNDEFKMSIASEQEKINVVVVGPSGTTASGTSGSVTTDKVNPIGVDFGVLDKDAPAAGVSNLIVVGGPCVNTVAARLSGNLPDCTTGFAEGEAKLTMFSDSGKVALLVAGYSGVDTLSATRALVTEVLPAKSSAKVITTNTKNPTVE